VQDAIADPSTEVHAPHPHVRLVDGHTVVTPDQDGDAIFFRFDESAVATALDTAEFVEDCEFVEWCPTRLAAGDRDLVDRAVRVMADMLGVVRSGAPTASGCGLRLGVVRVEDLFGTLACVHPLGALPRGVNRRPSVHDRLPQRLECSAVTPSGNRPDERKLGWPA
jgi:hypothetical protein